MLISNAIDFSTERNYFISQPYQIPLLRSEKVLLEHYSQLINEQSHCWPSDTYLAEKLHYSRRTIVNAKKELIRLGYIKKTGYKKGRTNQVDVIQVIHKAQHKTYPKTEEKPVQSLNCEVASHGIYNIDLTTNIKNTITIENNNNKGIDDFIHKQELLSKPTSHGNSVFYEQEEKEDKKKHAQSKEKPIRHAFHMPGQNNFDTDEQYKRKIILKTKGKDDERTADDYMNVCEDWIKHYTSEYEGYRRRLLRLWRLTLRNKIKARDGFKTSSDEEKEIKQIEENRIMNEGDRKKYSEFVDYTQQQVVNNELPISYSPPGFSEWLKSGRPKKEEPQNLEKIESTIDSIFQSLGTRRKVENHQLN
jgi:hypothetical protein